MDKNKGGITLLVSPRDVKVRKRMPRPGAAIASRREKDSRHRTDYLEQARRWG